MGAWANFAEPVQPCNVLLSFSGVRRIDFIDECGYQMGKNITADPERDPKDSRYKPLSEAGEANWSRRYYFRQFRIREKFKYHDPSPHW